ncbi:nucleoside diphosphate kinase [Entamoeba marina]
MQRSLVLLKPDAVLIRQASIEVMKCLEEAIPSYKLLVFEHHVVPAALGEQHYGEHKTKPFFRSLINMITNPNGVYVIVIEGEDCIAKIRTALGPTMVEKAICVECIRGKFGTCGGINCCHASDSPASAEKEIELWTSFFSIKFDEGVANKNLKELRDKYEGKFSSNMDNVREIVSRVMNDTKEYVTAMKSLTDADESMIKELLATIVLN